MTRATRSRAADSATAADTALPRLPRTFVPRTRLWQHLDKATASGVTMLVGPAGSGKTLGISGWLQSTGDHLPPDVVWVQADSTWTPARLSTVLDSANDHAGGPDSHDNRAATTLVVVDDAHTLPAATFRMIDARLREAPASLRLLLATRWDLALNRLVPELLGDLTVLRGNLLRMDETEAAALVAPQLQVPDPDVVEAIVQHAQGWSAALVLVARAVDAAPVPAALTRRLSERSLVAADQIASEVFAALSPRQRHLLLCLCGEDTIDEATAVHLTHDRAAPEVLAELELTGLMVSRIPAPADPDDDPAPARYVIHPLLAEVVRRRLSADGVDVARARATVARAVGLDLARGHAPKALARLVRMHAQDAAAHVLARDGVHLLLGHGDGDEIARFAREHPDVVEETPSTWFPIALERWGADDTESALHWAERIIAESRGGPRDGSGPLEPGPASKHPLSPAPDERATSAAAQVACVRLWRARLGLEAMEPAVDAAREVVADLTGRASLTMPDSVVLPVLASDIGDLEIWLGRLDDAEASLALAVSLCHSHGLAALAAASMSNLALAQYTAGRERAAVEVATEALGMLGAPQVWRMQFAPSRAGLALFLGGLAEPPWPTELIGGPPVETGNRFHRGDLSTRFWLRIREGRLALLGGDLIGAERALTAPVDDPHLQEAHLPPHLRVVSLMERAALAAMAATPDTLVAIEEALRSLGADGEAAFVAGLLAEGRGDRRAAAAEFDAAAQRATYAQPATRETALVCRAQLLDALGEHDTALDLLARAAQLTSLRRNATPFLGWSRQGTPIQTLLGRLADGSRSTWVRTLAEATEDRPDVIGRFEPTTAIRSEPREVEIALAGPQLSPREREVLRELARGATYADISAALFVSENTVKTHVSGCYTKLDVSCRSEALAVARAHHLI